MTLIDLDSKDVQNYTNKDGLIAVSDLRLLALADDYYDAYQVEKIIDEHIERYVNLRVGWMIGDHREDYAERLLKIETMLSVAESIKSDIMALRGDKE